MKRTPRRKPRGVSKPKDTGNARASERGEPAAALADERRLVHDLELHQLELEVQNRTLQENQELLEESRARYAELYDFAPVGHLTLDRKGIVRELNVTSATLLGLDRPRIRGLPFRVLLAVSSRKAFDAHLRACFTSDRPATVELVIPRPAGERRIVELVTVPLSRTHASGSSSARAVVHSALQDISERKRHEKAREDLIEREHAARVLAEEANRIKEAFLDVVSHELQTPVSTMRLWLKALRAADARDPVRARALEAIEASLELQSAMIYDLVDAARGRRGTLRVERRSVDLQRVVSAAVDALAPTCAAKHVELTLEPAAALAWVSGDATRLRQIVDNLLSNAIRFTRAGGHISVSLQARGSDVLLRVRDDGEGIEATRLEGIFEPFPSPDHPGPLRQGGLGLGLSIVSQLVAQHDGQVLAESDGKGHGACFTVTLRAIESLPGGGPS